MTALLSLYVREIETETLDLTVLSEDEMSRFGRMSAESGAAFALGRMILRRSLSKILRCSAENVPLVKQKDGSVRLEGALAPAFSLSHSGAYVAVALCEQSMKLGLDLEDMKLQRGDFRKISNRYFNKSEQNYLASCENPRNSFYQLWTAKEALVKLDRGAIAQYLGGAELCVKGHILHLIGVTPKGTENPILKSDVMDDLIWTIAADRPFDVVYK
ncbi:4'-phosphopantetheinyl transferase superfamily protein [Temperatibacter marinus]|uniref:4'-phosphopantetheinyl transferase superfamily protein n=1 Tax=Temperatibacter marinus TaxID=1456591 RepID=A0AA52H858_9PROT|nr:4'-phosphopantetheinyl transferase superfamily protein [Temperatibacter marinus]WND01494.1 4'-phosphopantetheinyl transferase superfamily protein [Temperatibacter marinus]